MSRLVLVDAHSLIHRSYHAVPPLTTSKGELVNAVFGFASILLKVLSELSPDYLAIAFDAPGPTFRHKDFKEYKAQRPALDQALGNQFERTREVAKAFGAAIFEVSGFEADDLIGTIVDQLSVFSSRLSDSSQSVGRSASYRDRKTEKLRDKSLRTENREPITEIIIVSGDRDELQLVRDGVKVYLPGRTMGDVTIYDRKKVKERYGFEPEQLVDFKALAGDQSDNIPGVAGIGETTASGLVSKFGTLENLYKNLDKVESRFADKLKAGEDSAYLSKKLATISLSAPVKIDLEKCKVDGSDRADLLKLFSELEFKSLIARVRGEAGRQAQQSFFEQPKVLDEDSNKLRPILEKMSKVGVLIDVAILNNVSKKIGKRLEELAKDIYKESGFAFNINSPKQLGEVLYDKLGLPVIKKTKTGRSTDEATLRELIMAHPIIPVLLEYRELFKLKSTYLDALPRFIGKDLRIHSEFRVDVTTTGRLSSQNPNLQNIPIRSDWGMEVRKAIVVPSGYLLVSFDYSQIELRVVAHLAGDQSLIEAFKKGLDVHSATAAKILDKKLGEVTTNDRRLAKTINFGLIYGMSAHGLAQQLRIDRGVAQKFIDDYFSEFPGVYSFMQRTINSAKQSGYVVTLMGAKIPVPQIQADNARIRAAGERMAVNYPVQAGAAEIIKKAMINIDKNLSQISQKTRMILQVHDELVFEVPEGDLKKVAKFVKEEMENAVKLLVPVVVEVKAGRDWGSMKPILNI